MKFVLIFKIYLQKKLPSIKHDHLVKVSQGKSAFENAIAKYIEVMVEFYINYN